MGGGTMYVWYPFIVNTTGIRKGEEVILEFDIEEVKKEAKRLYVDAFEVIKNKERKRLHALKDASASS